MATPVSIGTLTAVPSKSQIITAIQNQFPGVAVSVTTNPDGSIGAVSAPSLTNTQLTSLQQSLQSQFPAAFPQSVFVINSHQIDITSTGFVEINSFQLDLSRMFPNGFFFQINSFVSNAAAQGTYRLMNVTDGIPVSTLQNTLGQLNSAIYESALITSPVGLKIYTLEAQRTAGLGVQSTSIRGALLRN